MNSNATTTNLRDLWIFLCGISYSSPAACKEIKELTASIREHMPQDVRMLLEGIETRNAQKVSSWAFAHGVVIQKGTKLPDAAAHVLAENHRRKVFESCSGMLDFLRHSDPEHALTKLKEMTAMLESAGVQPQEIKNAKAKD